MRIRPDFDDFPLLIMSYGHGSHQLPAFVRGFGVTLCIVKASPGRFQPLSPLHKYMLTKMVALSLSMVTMAEHRLELLSVASLFLKTMRSGRE